MNQVQAHEVHVLQRSYNRKTKPESQLGNRIDILRRSNTALDDVDGFPPKCMQHTIANKTRRIRMDSDRLLADAATEGKCRPDRPFRCPNARHYFNQWHEVRRIPKMCSNHLA